MSPNEAHDAFAALASRPAVITSDLHRGHLDPAVATLPLPSAAAVALVERTGPILAEYRRLGVPIFHLITSYRDRAEILSNPYWRFQADRPDSARRAIAEHNLEGMPGLELMPALAGPGDAYLTTKKRYDCFVGTDLEFVLRSGGHDALLVLGVNTNSCVIATTIAASVRDFAVFVVDEGVDTMLGPELHDAARAVIGGSFGWLIDARSTIELLDARSSARARSV